MKRHGLCVLVPLFLVNVYIYIYIYIYYIWSKKKPCPSLVRPCPKSLVRPCPKPCPKVLSEALSEDLAVTHKSNLKESKSPCGSLRPKSSFGHHLKVLSEPCPSIAKSSFYCGGALYEAFEMSCLCGFVLSEVYGVRHLRPFRCGRHLVRRLSDSYQNADSCGFALSEACPRICLDRIAFR